MGRLRKCRICKVGFYSSDMHSIKFKYVDYQYVCIDCVKAITDFMEYWNRKLAEARAKREAAAL